MKLMTLGDRFLIAILIVISIFSMFYISGSAIDGSSAKVIVQVDGKQVVKYHLNMDKQPKNYDFKFGEHIGTIQMQEGRVRMLPMDLDICPGKVCSDMGWIQESYQMIVCLPNKIMVTIEYMEGSDMIYKKTFTTLLTKFYIDDILNIDTPLGGRVMIK